jgi:non-heme chloroperoxidase
VVTKKRRFVTRTKWLCGLFAVVAVASMMSMGCSSMSTSTPSTQETSVSADQVQQHFATATDGAPIEYFTHGNASAQPVVISPAFTGSARLYAEKFGQALPENFVVAVQLRGHGQGGGCTDRKISFCTQDQAPGDGTYSGFRISRLAQDIREVREELGIKRIAFIGHSLGMNVVCEYLSDFGLADVSGLFIYDQSPKNLDIGIPESGSFPAGIATYPLGDFANLVETFAVFTPEQGYPNVGTDLTMMLGGPDGDPVLNPAALDPSFLLTKQAWDEWSTFANSMNGKVISLLFASSITSDYTDVYRLVAESKIPVLVYGGKSSVVPWAAMQWIHDQIPGSEFMLFDENVGVHGTFLNPAPSGDVFMATMRSFFSRRVN